MGLNILEEWMPARTTKRIGPTMTPRLKWLLNVNLILFAILALNAIYLMAITLAGPEYQNWFYMIMFLVHLVLGLAMIPPVLVFLVGHEKRGRHRKNKRAKRVGYGLLVTTMILIISGIVLMRLDLFGIRLEIHSPFIRQLAYVLHIISPLALVWLYILHRLAGPKIKWKNGLAWASAAGILACLMVVLHLQDPREWAAVGPESGATYFFPSLSRTTTGSFIPERVLNNDQYCMECHQDSHESWSQSAHRFSSFNNPVYAFSVQNTRKKMMERDGHIRGSRFCAGCHDPVPFFSGAFEHPRYDDPNYDLKSDALAQAGITCTSCHSISHINSPRGNADFTIDEPIHYPFAFSEAPFLKWMNRQLVKAKPEFHKATFLKPLHKTTEFCGACHKVHIPKELNDYKFLRGQNHYDSFFLSGVSGQGIGSFYYPPKAEPNCNQCHMPLQSVDPKNNFGAVYDEELEAFRVHDHLFPSANTAMPYLVETEGLDPDQIAREHLAFSQDTVRLDFFGLRKGGAIDGELIAPLRPDLPNLVPGDTYLFELVVRTLKLGHLFTQGTADSNEVWIELEVLLNGNPIGHSGGLDQLGAVDPGAHFINAYVIDRHGGKIDRRNVEDIFISLYNHQIPPGAADSLHYQINIPKGASGLLTLRAKMHYRKFSQDLMAHVTGQTDYKNTLPIMTLAVDELVLPVGSTDAPDQDRGIEPWVRWNDYGIGLLRKSGRGQLGQAREAFEQVESLGRPDGPLNLARAYIREGLIQTHAPEALDRAEKMGANEWSILWFGSQVAAGNGQYEVTEKLLKDILRGGFSQAKGRGFDFSKDYRILNALGQALYQKGLAMVGSKRKQIFEEAVESFQECLKYDPENLSAHYGLSLLFKQLNKSDQAEYHGQMHRQFKPDDNARDRAIREARRRDPYANRAAESVVIYPLKLIPDYQEPVKGLRLEDGL